jgi:hypothetical protein
MQDFQYCGYCGDRMYFFEEHDEDRELCNQCLVKVPDEELEEAGFSGV